MKLLIVVKGLAGQVVAGEGRSGVLGCTGYGVGVSIGSHSKKVGDS